jgi:DnaJ family protein A protein 3
LICTGVEDGQTVRMPIGKKEIFITFRVEKSDYFRRDGSDVHTDVAISLAQAILGGSTRIQGIYENMTIDVSSSPLEIYSQSQYSVDCIRMHTNYFILTFTRAQIPAGTGSHTRIRLKGKGIRKVNGFGHGDHYVHVKIRVPARLTSEQEALLRAYAELEENTPGTVRGITTTTHGKLSSSE